MPGYKDTEWQDRAACKSADPEVFFSNTEKNIAAAKAYCRKCTVRNECLLFAVSQGIEFGVFGGQDEMQRKNHALAVNTRP